MGDYTRARATAKKLLKKFGKTITLTRVTSGTYDPVTGGTTGDVITNPTGLGVLLKFTNDEIDGTTILSSDRKLIYAGDEPKVNDKYMLERIAAVNPLDPDESGAILYTCQLSK